MFKWIAGTVAALLAVHWFWPKPKEVGKTDIAAKFPFMAGTPASTFDGLKVGDVVPLNVFPTNVDPTSPDAGKFTSVANVQVQSIGTYGPGTLVGAVVDVPSPAMSSPAKHGDAVYVVGA